MSKLLQINVTANWGSTGKIAEQIGQCALSHGWESLIAYGRYSNPSKSKLIKVGGKLDTYLHYGEQTVFDNEGLCSRSATRELVRQIEEIKPDVVHLHNIHDHYLNYRILFEYLNQTNIKVVWTFHDFWPVTGHCMHFVSKDCHRYEIECHNCPMQRVFPKTLMDRSRKNYQLKKQLFTACKNLTIVPVSEWVGEMTRKSFLKSKPIRVIHNGIDINVFKPTKLQNLSEPSEQLLTFQDQTQGKFVIMSVASQWAFDKGLDDYKRISTLLKDDEVIVLVGVSDEIKKSLPRNIIGINRTSNTTELATLYTHADVITILSLAETFGLTVVEGYACGTPAVVYDNTAPPSLIIPETGFVVENANWRAAYNAIQQIKLNGKQHFSESCISLARSEYDKDKCFEKYVSLYEKLIND